MNRRTFRTGSWVSLVAGATAAAAATVTAVIGVLALTDHTTFPAEYDLGPFSVRSTVSTPVAIDADVCQTADVMTQESGRDCFRSFLHDDEGSDPGRVRHQDADVRPTRATLKGQVELASTGGWSPLVASTVATAVVGLALLSGVLLLLWRLLAAAAEGEVFSGRTVRHLRGIGALVIAGSLLQPALDLLAGPGQLGYWWEAFGVAPPLLPAGSPGYPGGLNLGQLALGGLVILVAEVFRHGASIEAERRLTV